MAAFTSSRLFLNLPVEIEDKILRLLLRPNQAAVIRDYPPGPPPANLMRTQTTYKNPSGGRTTYLALELGGLGQSSQTLELSSQLLRVSRECYTLCVGLLYHREFWFAGMAEGAMAFLHDHRKEEHRIERCMLKFSPRGSVLYGPRTNFAAWRRLLNVLVHDREDLKALGLWVGEEFWDLAPWELPGGVESVYQMSGLLQPFGEKAEKHNFLQHFARLPPSVDLRLFIQDTGSPRDLQREDYIADLEGCIQWMSKARPILTEQHHVVCKTRKLEETCYWQYNKTRAKRC